MLISGTYHFGQDSHTFKKSDNCVRSQLSNKHFKIAGKSMKSSSFRTYSVGAEETDNSVKVKTVQKLLRGRVKAQHNLVKMNSQWHLDKNNARYFPHGWLKQIIMHNTKSSNITQQKYRSKHTQTCSPNGRESHLPSIMHRSLSFSVSLSCTHTNTDHRLSSPAIEVEI